MFCVPISLSGTQPSVAFDDFIDLIAEPNCVNRSVFQRNTRALPSPEPFEVV